MANSNRTLCGIYQIKNLVNGKVYIGSSVNIRARWAQHRSDLRKARHHSAALQRAWDKYGSAKFEFSVIELVEDIDTIFDRETFYVRKANSANGRDGYNTLVIGGSALGFKHTDESRRKMSESQKKIPYEERLKYCISFAGRTHTAETKALMSANSKRISPTPEQRAAISRVHKGKTISEEHKAISAETCRKRNQTPEHRAKVSAAHKGKTVSAEARAKLSAAAKGRKVSDETKEKIRLTLQNREFTPEHRAKIKASIAANKLRRAAQTV